MKNIVLVFNYNIFFKYCINNFLCTKLAVIYSAKTICFIIILALHLIRKNTVSSLIILSQRNLNFLVYSNYRRIKRTLMAEVKFKSHILGLFLHY